MMVVKLKGKNKAGETVTRFIPRVQPGDCMANDNEGLCLLCGNTQSGVEPDAERYQCEACGQRSVYGLDQFVLRGWCEVEGRPC